MKIFHSNCTLPPEGPNFVSAPNVRGTLDILWSCLSIVVLCTWSVLHLNVPVQSSPKRKYEKYRRILTRFGRKLKWMMFNILAPEWLLGKAWSDRHSAVLLERKFQKFAEKDGVPWTKAHVFLANMGGFAIRFGVETSTQELETNPDRNHEATRPGGAMAPSNTYVDSRESDPQNTNREFGFNGETIIQYALQPRDIERRHNSSAEVPVEGPNATPRRDTRPDSTSSSSIARSLDIGHPARPEELDGPPGFQEQARVGLPPEIQNAIKRWSESRWLSIDALGEWEKKLSQNIGPITWAVNSANTRTVARALGILSISHFEDKWEKDRFRLGYKSWFANLHVLQGDTWILDANQLLLARELEIIEALPRLSDDELEDRNKGDFLVKFLALGQVLWLMIQLGTRVARGIPSSQFEIVALAFAICTGITYVLLLDKPKDVQAPIWVNATKNPTAEEMIRLAIRGPYIFGPSRHDIWIPNNAIHREREEGKLAMLIMNLGCAFAIVIFGAVHCLAWDLTFPTGIEKLLWRISAVLTLAMLPVEIIIIYVFWKFFATKGFRLPKHKFISKVIFWVFSAPFIFARAFVIVEVFRSLVYLPPDAFLNTWSSSIPNMG